MENRNKDSNVLPGLEKLQGERIPNKNISELFELFENNQIDLAGNNEESDNEESDNDKLDDGKLNEQDEGSDDKTEDANAFFDDVWNDIQHLVQVVTIENWKTDDTERFVKLANQASSLLKKEDESKFFSLMPIFLGYYEAVVISLDKKLIYSSVNGSRLKRDLNQVKEQLSEANQKILTLQRREVDQLTSSSSKTSNNQNPNNLESYSYSEIINHIFFKKKGNFFKKTFSVLIFFSIVLSILFTLYKTLKFAYRKAVIFFQEKF